jgi:hypothetical protein
MAGIYKQKFSLKLTKDQSLQKEILYDEKVVCLSIFCTLCLLCYLCAKKIAPGKEVTEELL